MTTETKEEELEARKIAKQRRKAAVLAKTNPYNIPKIDFDSNAREVDRLQHRMQSYQSTYGGTERLSVNEILDMMG